MDPRELIAALNNLQLNDAERAASLREAVKTAQDEFEDRARRLTMSSEDLKLTYSL